MFSLFKSIVLLENINYSVHFLQYSILRNIHFLEKISDTLSDPEWDNSYSYQRFWAGCDGLKWWAPVLSPMCSVWRLLCVPLLDPEHTLEEDQVLFYCSSFMSVLCAQSSKPFFPGIVSQKLLGAHLKEDSMGMHLKKISCEGRGDWRCHEIETLKLFHYQKDLY